MVKERNAKREGRAYAHYDAIRGLLMTTLGNLDREERHIRFAKRTPVVGEGKITPADVERAKAVPIETLYQGQLKRTGNRLTGICPFHNETGPSFVIYLEQGKFYCYGCSERGDSINFIILRDSLKFIDAVKLLIGK